MFHPDDPLFQRFRIRMETEQGTLARPPKPGGEQTPLPFWVADDLAPKDGIIPLESNALALRFNTLRRVRTWHCAARSRRPHNRNCSRRHR